jgi:hypothetical protein
MARGRKSAASLSVVRVMPAERPAPPADLCPEAAEEWVAIVARMPPDFFMREMHALLAQFCRHTVTSRLIARLIDTVPSEALHDWAQLQRYGRLLAMQDRESKALANLATRMRITNQSRYTTRSAATASRKSVSSKPWEYGS